MQNLQTLLKSLKIKNTLKTSLSCGKTIYYFEGSKDSLNNIELKLLTSTDAQKLLKNLTREFFNNNYGRLSFELL